jgi:hypothetical protein
MRKSERWSRYTPKLQAVAKAIGSMSWICTGGVGDSLVRHIGDIIGSTRQIIEQREVWLSGQNV